MKRYFSLVFAVVTLSALVMLMSCQTKEVTSAKVYIQQNNWDKAIEQLEQAVVLYPNDAEAHYLLGDAYSNRSEWTRMNEMFNKSLAIAPTFQDKIRFTREKYWGMAINQGVAKVNTKDGQRDLEGAGVDFATANEIDPGHPEGYKYLALTQRLLKKYDEALSTYAKYFELKSDDLVVMNEVTLIHLEKKSFDKAIEMANKVLAIDPNNFEALTNTANAYINNGQNDLAQKTYEEALLKKPDDPDLMFNLAQVYYMNKDFDKSVALFQKVIEKAPEDYEANLYVGNAYLNMGDDFHKSLLEKQNNNQTITDEEIAQRDGFYKNAITYLEKAVSLKPDNSAVYYNIGIAYVRLGDQKKGQEYFDKSEVK